MDRSVGNNHGFKYTVGGGVLSEEQRRFYEVNGYVVIKNNVSEALIDEVSNRLVEICDGKVKGGLMRIVKDPSLKQKGVQGINSVHKVQDFLYDDILFKYASDPAVTAVVTSIIGPNITGTHSMLLNKPPDADPGSSLHPVHQDLHAFPFRPADRIVASWTAMEKIDRSNGGLYVVPGSHNLELQLHDYFEDFKNTLYFGVKGFDHLPKAYLEMEKGDTVFFHPLILHGSGPNFTKRFRKAISCHYADSNCSFFDVKGTVQENVAVEIMDLLSKFGYSGNFIGYWKMKSRLIKGPPGNFQNFDSHL
ncbi:phytanoyl-CoA dioxygenase, peroxisomal-like [Zophobas morio]|uniref:phytanoyl-CoA dioxygenase, peroxisomal-like n=1 Tax=Zophobas morio TaxID=2755281 RepID=UPI0030829A4C